MDAYEVQRLRQVHGLRCEYCSSLSGHTSKCYLLSAAPRELVLTGPDFDDTKYQPLNPEATIEEAVAAVNKYYRKGSPKVTKAVVPSEADHIALHGLGVKWEENV